MDVLIFIIVLAVMCDWLTRSWRIGGWRGWPAIHMTLGNFLLLVSVYTGSKLLPDAEAQRRKDMRTT
jgi:ABC-type uncharacterized transport system permease subunit